jgi:hypothetical protein
LPLKYPYIGKIQRDKICNSKSKFKLTMSENSSLHL